MHTSIDTWLIGRWLRSPFTIIQDQVEREEGDGDGNMTVWPDKAISKLLGAVSRHSCAHYVTENPHITLQEQLNQPGVTV